MKMISTLQIDRQKELLKKIVLFAIVFWCPLAAICNDKEDTPFDFTHNRASISGMLTSSDAWQVELGYHYMFSKYVGLGGTAGVWSVYFEEGFPSGNDWEIDSDDSKPFNVFLRPSVVLKTPGIHIKQVIIGLFAEPGIMLNVPYAHAAIRQYSVWPNFNYETVSTGKGQWFGLDVRLGIYINLGPCGFSAGYLMSNFDVYSQYRHLTYKGNPFSNYYPEKSFMQGAYLTASYYF